MKWFEIIRDLGDGSSAVYRFRTKEDAQKLYDLWDSNNEVLDWTIHEVDSESEEFFGDVGELLEENGWEN